MNRRLITLPLILVITGLGMAQNIHQAIQQGNIDAVRAILAEKPDVLESRNERNLTPLILASLQGHTEIVRCLLEKGADLNATDNEGSNVLHNAAAGGHDDIMALFFARGMDVNAKDNRGMTALHFACSRGFLPSARFLISEGADVHAEENNGRTSLFFAAASGNLDLCRLLIENGAHADVQNRFARTPLTYAIWRDHQDVADLLISNGADVNLKDVDGNAPLHLACSEGQTSMAKRLIDHGADIGLEDATGHTPLHIAANYGCSGIVGILLDGGMDVNARDQGGDTPIHGAAWSGDRATVELLIQKGADVKAENNIGRTPLGYAAQAGYGQIMDILKQKGAIMDNQNSEPKSSVSAKGGSKTGQTDPVKMTVLYDNYVAAEGTQAEWGFSCLIEGTEKTILFDTGGDANVLMHNIDFLKVDLEKVDQIVISHNHWDHTGGLYEALERNAKPPVYALYSFPYDFVRQVQQANGSVVPVNEPVEICKDVFLTGQMGDHIKEQSLIVNTSQGLVIVTGCSHQGIVNILKKAKEMFDKEILLVFGGFHLMQHTDDQVHEIIQSFRDMGVQKCGATHCTGDRQITLFQEAYGDNYVPIGTGRIIRISEEGIQSEIAK